MNDGDGIRCTSLDQDWGDEQPNMLMHPPCLCPRCAPETNIDPDSPAWLSVPGSSQRRRVEPAELGETGRAKLG